jgi:hypothetical protein
MWRFDEKNALYSSSLLSSVNVAGNHYGRRQGIVVM